MFSYLFKLELKNHLSVMLVLILVQLALSSLLLINYNKYMGIYMELTPACWILACIYIFVDLYNNFYRGKDLLFHMVPIKTSQKLFIKAVVFSAALILMMSTCLIFELFSPQGMYNSRILVSSNADLGLAYLILPKFFGCISQVVLLGLSVILSKLFNNKVLSIIICVIILIGIPIGLYDIMKLNLLREGIKHVIFSIGTSSEMTFRQYAGVLPIVVEPSNISKVPDIISTIHWNNVIANILVIILGGSSAACILDNKKYEVIGK